MTAPHREEVHALLASVSAQVVAGIAEGRKLSPGAVRAAIDSGPLLADEAPRQSSSTISAIATKRLPPPASAPERRPS